EVTLATSLIGDSLGVAGAHANLSARRKIGPAWSGYSNWGERGKYERSVEKTRSHPASRHPRLRKKVWWLRATMRGSPRKPWSERWCINAKPSIDPGLTVAGSRAT